MGEPAWWTVGSGMRDDGPMDLRLLRATPVLPEAYFEVRDVLERTITREALFGRPVDLAVFHAVAALERQIWEMRPAAALALDLRRRLGLPVEVSAYSMVIHGVGYGLTQLLRLLHQRAPGPVGAVAFDAAALAEAGSALRVATRISELFIVFGDVELGWRDCVVDDRTLRVPSRSPERLVRSLQRSLDLEAERNELLIRVNDPAQLALQQRYVAIAADTQEWYEPEADVLQATLDVSMRAWQRFDNSRLPDELRVRDRFTAGEYRAVSRVLKAYALAQQAVTDYQVPRPEPRPVRKRAGAWIALATERTGIDADRVRDACDLLLHARARDLRENGRVHPAIAHTPLIDCGDGSWVLSPTLAMWHDTNLALRAMWKNRAPNDYNAVASARNRELATDAARLFRERGWRAVLERPIPGVGDIDAGAGVPGDPLFVSAECKVFLDDPVRGADDPEVWRQLARTTDALREEGTFRQVLGREGLAPGEIKGVVLVPGRAQIPFDLGADYALVGVDDLADAVRASATPREAWERLKAGEREATIGVEEAVEEVDGWRIVSDGVPRTTMLRRRQAQ